MKVVQTQIRLVDYYALLDLDSFAVGDMMAFDIYIKKDNGYVIIIEAGTLLSENLYAKLKKQDNLYIFKDDKDKLSLNCESLKYYIKYNKDNLEKRVKFVYELNSKLFSDYLDNKDNKIDLDCVTSIVKSIIYLIKYDEKFLKNTIPFFIEDNSISNHSLHVTIYAMNLGNQLNLNSKRLLQLGTAALLHDTGLKKIDESLLNKDSQLDITELEEVQKHPQYSIEIIKQNGILDPYIIDAIMHHHERYDGNGYPDQLNEKNISLFASILSISDVFDALTSYRPYREQYSSFDAIKMMIKDASMVNKFNNQYLQTLLKSL